MEKEDDWRQHKTVIVEEGEWKAKIDERLAPLIRAIWKAGIETTMCCQEFHRGIAWIAFASADDLTAFLNLVGIYESGDDTLYNRINYRNGAISAPLWEYFVNVGDLQENNGYHGPPDFNITIGLFFPVCDIPALLKRLTDIAATGQEE